MSSNILKKFFHFIPFPLLKRLIGMGWAPRTRVSSVLDRSSAGWLSGRCIVFPVASGRRRRSWRRRLICRILGLSVHIEVIQPFSRL
jgi:hypothetical protein